MGPVGTGDWGLGLGLDNFYFSDLKFSFDMFIILHADLAGDQAMSGSGAARVFRSGVRVLRRARTQDSGP